MLWLSLDVDFIFHQTVNLNQPTMIKINQFVLFASICSGMSVGSYTVHQIMKPYLKLEIKLE
jgi:hypothetical protein